MEQIKDEEMLKKSLCSYSGYYITQECIPMDLKNEISEDFINEFGAKAVPVSSQSDMEGMKKRGYKPVIVSEAKKNVILASEYFQDVEEENRKIREMQRPLSDRLCEFIERIEDKLDEMRQLRFTGFWMRLRQMKKKRRTDRGRENLLSNQ